MLLVNMAIQEQNTTIKVVPCHIRSQILRINALTNDRPSLRIKMTRPKIINGGITVKVTNTWIHTLISTYPPTSTKQTIGTILIIWIK
jgi:hypothetical protein